MPLALIISSYVAGSRVGGMAQALALAPFKVDPVVIPTTLFGRHPGWGPPGGAAMDAGVMAGMIDGVAANGLLALTDVILTGYFASAEQVAIAARTIDRTRTEHPSLTVIVDPVMGDRDTGLYVRPEVADAIARDLVPRADVITPNLWELGRLTGTDPHTTPEAVAATRTLGRAALVTSVPGDSDEIGLLLVNVGEAILGLHRRLTGVPRGTGDLVAALYAAAMIEGLPAREALIRTAAGVAEAAEAAVAWAAPELPLVALGERLVRPSAEVRIDTLH